MRQLFDVAILVLAIIGLTWSSRSLYRWCRWCHSRPLPVTSIQDAALDILAARGEMSGRDLRTALAACGHSRDWAAFYQLMADMKDVNVVESWDVEQDVHGIVLRKRWYRMRQW